MSEFCFGFLKWVLPMYSRLASTLQSFCPYLIKMEIAGMSHPTWLAGLFLYTKAGWFYAHGCALAEVKHWLLQRISSPLRSFPSQCWPRCGLSVLSALSPMPEFLTSPYNLGNMSSPSLFFSIRFLPSFVSLSNPLAPCLHLPESVRFVTLSWGPALWKTGLIGTECLCPLKSICLILQG